MENYDFTLVGAADASEKATFYKRTYLHVAGAILAFLLVESLLITLIPTSVIVGMLSSKMTWLFVIGLFWLISSMVNKFAFSTSKSQQYVGLGLYVLIEALIFLPMIYISIAKAGYGVLAQAGILTLFMFTGISSIAFSSKRDFSFLRSYIILGGFISLGLIVVAALFGFNLGLWFSLAMVLLAAVSILYQTSQLETKYHTGQYVGAAVQIFASIMLLFWYILRILNSRK